ncbi:hypothetical protein [Singulisphaera sp. PoT]|uniref:hypothetical protein n=1 Tax=Singulisphaera sp. PoT TaxID=3411797 RepID=UPI003BF548FE
MKRIGFLGLILALAAFGGAGVRSAQANPVTYTTYGSIDGKNPGSPISWTSANSSFYMPGSINLGGFNSALNMPDSITLTYDHTPYTIDVFFGSGATQSQLEINGTINGTITGTSSSTMQASVSSITQVGGNPLPFPLSDFQVLSPQTISATGPSPFYAYVNYTPVPEPTTLALCGMIVAGLGVRHWRRRLV